MFLCVNFSGVYRKDIFIKKSWTFFFTDFHWSKLLIVIFLSTELYALLVSLFKHVITVCL